MVFHVALLGEPDAANLTFEGLLSSVLDHVNLQSALLIKGLVTLTALEGTFACRTNTDTDRCYKTAGNTRTVVLLERSKLE